MLTVEKLEVDDNRPSSLRSGFRIDLDEVRRIIQPHVHKKVQEIATRAEIESLAGIGEPGEVMRLYDQLVAERRQVLANLPSDISESRGEGGVAGEGAGDIGIQIEAVYQKIAEREKKRREEEAADAAGD